MGHLTYLVFELVWGMPVLLLQWAVGRGTLWRLRRPIIIAILIPTAYLSIADGVAIASGIWTLHHNRITGLTVAGVPIEEVLFFLLTNTMIVQSIALVGYWRRRREQFGG